jgi:hypothetical protein
MSDGMKGETGCFQVQKRYRIDSFLHYIFPCKFCAKLTYLASVSLPISKSYSHRLHSVQPQSDELYLCPLSLLVTKEQAYLKERRSEIKPFKNPSVHKNTFFLKKPRIGTVNNI